MNYTQFIFKTDERSAMLEILKNVTEIASKN